MKLRIATRGSKLALWQAEHVRSRLRTREPSLEVDLVVVQTAGDRTLDRPLSAVGGKGLFVKEVEEALLDGRADLAVHSMKDLPSEIPPGLYLAAVPERADPRDALLVRPGLSAQSIAALPARARVGTSSLRRVCLLRGARRDLDVWSLRGNVDTRLRKLQEGEVDAIVLAVAGLTRLGFQDRITAILDAHEFVPAIGQGALAIEAREGDPLTTERLKRLHHDETGYAVAAERAFLARLDGSCRTPIAAHATMQGSQLRLEGLVGHPDGTRTVRGDLEGPATDGETLGHALAHRLLAHGAGEILRAVRDDIPVGGS